LQGSVVVYLEVDPTGDVENTQIIQSLGLGLDENAVAAVKQWRFKPGTIDGMPAKMAQSAEVTFSLDHSNSWQIRRSGYRVNRTEADQVAQLTKPMLNQYASPAPEACRADGDVVVVIFQVTKAGKPERVKIIEQRGEDASAATLKAIPLWRFQPGLLNGKPREASASIEMECRASATTASISETSGGSYRVGAGVSAPVILYKVEPEYSAEARRAKFQGTVVMTFQVDTSGHPINIRMVRSLGLGLDVKAMEALNQWRFRPGAKDGKPVSVFSTVEVSFRLL
jgi:TonB family protein